MNEFFDRMDNLYLKEIQVLEESYIESNKKTREAREATEQWGEQVFGILLDTFPNAKNLALTILMAPIEKKQACNRKCVCGNKKIDKIYKMRILDEDIYIGNICYQSLYKYCEVKDNRRRKANKRN